ncbi:hypothetical protein Amet_3761 [Alkaliphilus metalliredigens QYMF]|uniref:Uncharacterized protein n=1 Tax=Alkaliphilus metalliredigens (strain QYMF) TaxID=293826 RepID=A6TUL2_ALKMQ|nr:ABC transporter permease [Alkaliphilus metalliredigens]ABR49880.1 hypothetical protein Amet_3761 [Alkaliphilus metalliredigens QYMF]
MNPIFTIWKKRIGYLHKLHFRFISFQIDWVIAIYAVLIFGFIGYGFYPIFHEVIVREINPLGKMVVNSFVLMMLLGGELKGYLKTADQVFLIPLSINGRQFISYSHRLSAVIHIGTWSVFWIILYFYYRLHYQVEIMKYLALWLGGIFIKLIIINSKFIIENQRGRWKRRIIRNLFYGFCSLAIGYIVFYYNLKTLSSMQISIGLIILGVMTSLSFLIKNKVYIDWERIIEEEVNKRVKGLTVLLGEGSKNKKVFRKRTTRIFSGRKFIPFTPKGALLLLYFKIILRGKGNLLFLLQIIGGTFASIYLFNRGFGGGDPSDIRSMNAIGIVFMAYLIGDLLLSIWKSLKEDTWFIIYPYSHKDKIFSMKLGVMIGLSICLLIISVGMMILTTPLIHPTVDLIGAVLLAICITQIQMLFFY